YYRDISALEKLMEVLEKMKSLSLIVDTVTLVEYHRALMELIENEAILKKDRNIEGIKVLNPINSRGINHKILFVTGLSSTYYPNIRENNFLINDVNFSELKQIGIEFKNYQDRLNNEAIKFASILSSVENKLYLSYCQGEEEDSIQSIFLDELLNMIEPECLRQSLINVDMGYYFKDKHSITTSDELANYLILNHWKLPKEQVEDYFSYHNENFQDKFRSINERFLCEFERSNNSLGEYSGVLSKKDIREDLYKIHENKVYSITYLEAYGRCPYYFLLNKVLNVEEMERIFQEYSPMDIGILYHEVLRQYYTYHRESIWNYVEGKKGFILGNTIEYLRDITEEKARQLGFDLGDKLNLLIIENAFAKIKNFIEKDLERITKSEERLLPYAFEVDFGKYGDFEINIHHKEIKFRGTIDRIDKVMGEDKYLIMDYKSSSYGVYDIEQMRKGLSLQLPVYLLSQKDKKIVGGLYGLISSSKFDIKLGLMDETKHITKRHKGALDEDGLNLVIDEVKERVYEMLEDILMGNFPVNPQECSPYCIYKDICRYENLSEVE
ncbi:MAG: PD-(D/E)XK nuclease family protein, partial [Tissierellaceae bacterium]